MKYAALFLGLLITPVGFAGGLTDACTSVNFSKECDAERNRDLADASWRSKEEESRSYEQAPIQVITPNSSYLAYPSPDGRTIQIYDRTER